MVAVDQKTNFSHLKNSLAHMEHLESLKCLRWYQNASKGTSRPFKVLTLVCTKIFDIMQLYVSTRVGNQYQRSTQNMVLVRLPIDSGALYIHIIIIVLSQFSLAHSLIYVQKKTITFYHVLISNVRMRSNNYKQIVIFYSIQTYSFQSAIKF